MDVHTPAQRSHNMRRIRGRDTKPELLLRRGLHAAGLRFRLHARQLPGRPDLVFPARRAVILVHGCFWHGHSCPMFRLPTTRPEFWANKIGENRARDVRTKTALHAASWRTLIVWECALRGPARQPLAQVIVEAADFVRSETSEGEISGGWPSMLETDGIGVPTHGVSF
jgi:DNA mismatch endonuclease, patch repair protein